MSSNTACTASQLQLSNTAQLQSRIDEEVTPKRHGSYYFDRDPMAVFLVGDELFKVHRYYLTQGSEVFRGMFTSPPEEGKNVDGMDDNQPIILPEVTMREFEALMDYLYLQPHASSRYNDVKQNLNFYINLLSISHRFIFDDIFEYAHRQLKSIMNHVPVETRFLIGDKYDFKDWSSSAFETLMERYKSITADECKAMGVRRLMAFIKAREFRYRERLQIAEEKLKRTEESNGSSVSQSVERVPTSDRAILEMFSL